MHATYEALVEENRPALARLARRLSRTADDAEDLLQESLLDAYRSFERFRPGSHFYNWFARIMTNNQLDRVRRQRETVLSLDTCGAEPDSGPIEVPDERSNPERLVLDDMLDAHFRTALDRLDPNQRATVLLCDLEGATYEEAAAATQCPIGTIRSRLHRAHKSMERWLAPVVPHSTIRRAEPRQTRREFLAGTAAAGAALAGLTMREAGAAPAAEPKQVACPLHLQSLLGTAGELDTPRGALQDLRLTSVLVVDAKLDAALNAEQLAEITRRVRHRGLGLVVLHPGESRVLRALFGTPCGWDQSTAPEAGGAFRVTAPRHPVSCGLDRLQLPALNVAPGSYQGPRPDVVVFASEAEGGARSWGAVTWSVGRGRVCCLRPQEEALHQHAALGQVFRNAIEWCAGS